MCSRDDPPPLKDRADHGSPDLLIICEMPCFLYSFELSCSYRLNSRIQGCCQPTLLFNLYMKMEGRDRFMPSCNYCIIKSLYRFKDVGILNNSLKKIK